MLNFSQFSAEFPITSNYRSQQRELPRLCIRFIKKKKGDAPEETLGVLARFLRRRTAAQAEVKCLIGIRVLILPR